MDERRAQGLPACGRSAERLRRQEQGVAARRQRALLGGPLLPGARRLRTRRSRSSTTWCTRYPKSDKAPAALWEQGNLFLEDGQLARRAARARASSSATTRRPTRRRVRARSSPSSSTEPRATPASGLRRIRGRLDAGRPPPATRIRAASARGADARELRRRPPRAPGDHSRGGGGSAASRRSRRRADLPSPSDRGPRARACPGARPVAARPPGADPRPRRRRRSSCSASPAPSPRSSRRPSSRTSCSARLELAHVVVGYNVNFGRKRAGTVETLRTLGDATGLRGRRGRSRHDRRRDGEQHRAAPRAGGGRRRSGARRSSVAPHALRGRVVAGRAARSHARLPDREPPPPPRPAAAAGRRVRGAGARRRTCARRRAERRRPAHLRGAAADDRGALSRLRRRPLRALARGGVRRAAARRADVRGPGRAGGGDHRRRPPRARPCCRRRERSVGATPIRRPGPGVGGRHAARSLPRRRCRSCRRGRR